MMLSRFGARCGQSIPDQRVGIGTEAFVADMVGRAVNRGRTAFAGDAEGNFMALEATSGKVLWRLQCGASVYSSPMSFGADGKRYLAIAVGCALFTFVLPQ
jgi:outer membrane protein assembly factor BamB